MRQGPPKDCSKMPHARRPASLTPLGIFAIFVAAFGTRDRAERVKNRSTRQCHVKRCPLKSLRALMFRDGIILKTMLVGANKHRKVALIGRLGIVSHCLYGRSETRAAEIVPDSAKKCHFSGHGSTQGDTPGRLTRSASEGSPHLACAKG